MDKYEKRRLALLICITILAAVAGFVWGKQYGYDQGKADILKTIEKQLNGEKQVTSPI